MRFEIQRCRAEQAERLTAIAHASKRHWGYSESCIEAWRDELTVCADAIDAHAVFAASTDDGALAGFYMLIERGERAEVEHFWVVPDRIRRGVGRLLFEHAVRTATRAGAMALDIASDPHAQPFYLRMGARRVGSIPAPIDGEPRRCLPRLVLEIGGPR